MNVAKEYAEELREFRPIVYEGLEFYPLTVKHFALYQSAKTAMELMLSSLPLRFVRMTWIQALEAMDREAKEANGENPGYLLSVLALLDAAIKLDIRHNPNSMLILHDKNGAFGGVIVKQGTEAPSVLTADKFDAVRQILGAQNSYEIPDENWNPELVRAQQYLRGQNRSGGGGSLEDAVFALAAATGNRATDIWNWPIREYLQMQSAVDRRLHFQICTAAELSGQVKFKHGNPYPTWITQNRSGLPAGFVSLKELDDGANGLLAIPNDTHKE